MNFLVGEERYIASMGEGLCPMGCIYCFVDSEGYRGIQKIDFETDDFADLEVSVIQPCCDMEIFLVPNWKDKLEALSRYNKSISFATKSKVNKNDVVKISELDAALKQKGELINIAVSITSFRNDWQEIEKFTPSPHERLETLKLLFQNGIFTSVAVRPLLPFLDKYDILELIQRTSPFTHAYLLGPLYLTPMMKDYLVQKKHHFLSKTKKVDWLLNSQKMEFIESHYLEKMFKSIANRKGLIVFDNNIDLVRYLKQSLNKDFG